MDKKILIVTTVSITLRAFLLPISNYFRERGCTVDCYARGVTGDSSLKEHFDNLYEASWTRGLSKPLALWKSAISIRTLVEQERYDIVHVHTPIAGVVVRFALRRSRLKSSLKVVYTAHGFHFCKNNRGLKNFLYRAVERVCARWLDALITINQEDYLAANKDLGIPLNKLFQFPGVGITPKHYQSELKGEERKRLCSDLNLSAIPITLLMVAEFNPGKRHFDAIDCLSGLSDKSVVLMLAGEGPLLAAAKEYAKQKGVYDRVRFLGYRNDISQLLALSTLVVFPSVREGLPRFIMEAMAAGVPIVGYDIRGVRDLLASDIGLLCESRDVWALTRNVNRLLADGDLRQQMKHKGQKAILQYDISKVIEAHHKLYEKLWGRA